MKPETVTGPLEGIVRGPCQHPWTRGREGEKGSWCGSCDEKVWDVDPRPCGECLHAKKVVGGWICSKHLMAVSPTMNVTYRVSEKSCWTPNRQ